MRVINELVKDRERGLAPAVVSAHRQQRTAKMGGFGSPLFQSVLEPFQEASSVRVSRAVARLISEPYCF